MTRDTALPCLVPRPLRSGRRVRGTAAARSGEWGRGRFGTALAKGLALAAALAAQGAPTALAGPSAVTLYALNCMGCHPPPVHPAQPVQPLRGQFADGATGREFFIGLPQPAGRALAPEEEALMLSEVMTWKRSCSVILQQAPLVVYGERAVDR